MLTDTLTGLLLAFGAILVAFALAGFYGNWTSRPDHDSLQFLRAVALTGQGCTAAGLALHLFAHALPGLHPALIVIALAVAATGRLTRTSNRIIPTGAAA